MVYIMVKCDENEFSEEKMIAKVLKISKIFWIQIKI